jgi:lipopolysaccharide/colanic/teichoic acid biosynthesis glycosyltransferase
MGLRASHLKLISQTPSQHRHGLGLSEDMGGIESEDIRSDYLIRGLEALKLYSDVRVIGGLDYYENLSGRIFLGVPAGPLFFSKESFKIDKISLLIKDVWERLLALSILLMTLPHLLIVPIAIWLETGRPLLFVQPRVGRKGKVYNLYKWRSMFDDKVTRVGRLIRATKLDELPQLINVLKGEMSLVGPRPELPHFVDDFRRANRYYNLRHMVKPGLTGWAQIMFPDAKAEHAMTKLAYDLYYVKHFSLVSDMVIMIETFKMIVFRNRGRQKSSDKANLDDSPPDVPPKLIRA